MQSILDDVTPDELELWAGKHRKIGKPSNAEIETFDRRDAKIVEVAMHCTENYSQTIRHIYYLCSGLGLIGKDHGKLTYWYEMVENAIGKARWNRKLDWDRIADNSRPFERPVTWDDDSAFLQSAIPQFAMDKWTGQEYRVVVCVEKDAIMGMLSDLCHRWHVPIMSFHGQASDGGAVYELAKHIAAWRGECEFVRVLYLGDFDTCGCLIDRVAFGDTKADDQDPDTQNGKVNRLLWQLTDYAEDAPCVLYERIGITPDDVMNADYASFLLEANDDSNFDRYLADTSEIEGFPQVEGFTSKGKSRGMVPATLGIDALDHVELIRRTKAAIKSDIAVGAWKAQADSYRLHRGFLRQRIG